MSRSWIRRLFCPPTPSTIRRTKATIGFERLETRDVPAFLSPVTYAAGVSTAGVAVGDFNSDGRDDLGVVDSATGNIGVMLSNTDGTFQAKVDYAAGAFSIDATAGDLNGDGKLDLVVVGTTQNLSVLLGNGDGTFGTATTYSVAPSAHSVKLGDFNNDGKLDVGVMNVNSASVLLGNGDGTLQTHIDAAATGNNINLVVGDFDRDGNLDMATSVTNSVGTVTVLRGRGDGTMSAATSYSAFSAPVYLGTGDFNHDGYLDFVCPNSYSATSMSVIMNNGDGTYAAPHTYGIAQTGVEIEVADFNNDGNQDFAVRGSSEYMVHLGKGDGTFYAEQTYAIPAGRWESGSIGDFNGDGAVDLVFSSGNGIVVTTNDHADYQNLAGAVTFRVTAPDTTTSGSVLPMTISAIDANGNVAVGFRGVAYLSSSDPAASTAAGYAFNPLDAGIPYVFTAADAGTHTFVGAIRLVTGGDQTVTVSAPNLAPATAHVLVTGQVTKLAFSAPAATTAGDTFQVTVSAVDAVGTVATAYTSSVHFSSTDGLAGLPADYTFTAADAGTHTFTVTLKTAGNKTVSVTEVGGTIGGSTNISVNAAAVQSLALAGGSGAIGFVRPVTVVAQDAFGNVDTTYNGTVHVTSSDASAILPPNTTLVNGVGTFNVTLLTVGTQTITATDVANGTLTGTVSSDATPPIPTQFNVTGYALNTTAGVANTFTVTVRDSIGQIATGYTDTVYFSSSDQQAGLPASYTFTAADAGVHTFTATLKTAGVQSISVRDAAGVLVGTQGGITVGAAAFAGYRLSVPLGTDSKGHMLVAAGDNIALTVRAVDAYGNTVLGYKGKAKFSSTDTKASVPTDYNFTVADAGVHTFNVVLKTATPNAVVWSVSVVDASSAATLTTLTNFEVTNGAPASFSVSVSSNPIVGSPFTVKVTVLDAYGNTVKNYFGTIHFGSTATSLGLPADYTFTATDAGVHTFSITPSTAGTFSIDIFDTATPSLKTTIGVTVKSSGGTGGGGTGGGGTGGGGTGGGGRKP